MTLRCAYCDTPIERTGKSGRPSKYCTPEHRDAARRAPKPGDPKPPRNPATKPGAESLQPPEPADRARDILGDTRALRTEITAHLTDLTGHERTELASHLADMLALIRPKPTANPRPPIDPSRSLARTHVEPIRKARDK